MNPEPLEKRVEKNLTIAVFKEKNRSILMPLSAEATSETPVPPARGSRVTKAALNKINRQPKQRNTVKESHSEKGSSLIIKSNRRLKRRYAQSLIAPTH